eukprot:TRINITY_DN15907_c0_g1_i1.p2 TRINITY_DN15907_c0_g1~~TRINITY_DN15907_c0_g1_i1.p2  ORF type:complete len:61 (-),score=1.10 TRINITY_DN15907_c0_g1_i1:291-473(-)
MSYGFDISSLKTRIRSFSALRMAAWRTSQAVCSSWEIVIPSKPRRARADATIDGKISLFG